MNAAPLTIANAEATAAADDEITIGEPRFIIERRVAVMLEKSQRQLDSSEQVMRTRVTMRSDASVTDSDPSLGEPSAPLHQGIKTTIAPAGNVEARGWRPAPGPCAGGRRRCAATR